MFNVLFTWTKNKPQWYFLQALLLTVGANSVLALRSSFQLPLLFGETVIPFTCLPMRAGAELDAGFAIAVVFFS